MARQQIKKLAAVTTGLADNRPSLRNGFNGVLRTLPGNRAFLLPSSARSSLADLTPASGCQDHTTSPSASAPFVRTESIRARRQASIASRLTFGDDWPKRPLHRGGTARGNHTFLKNGRKIFHEKAASRISRASHCEHSIFRARDFSARDSCKAARSQPRLPDEQISCTVAPPFRSSRQRPASTHRLLIALTTWARRSCSIRNHGDAHRPDWPLPCVRPLHANRSPLRSKKRPCVPVPLAPRRLVAWPNVNLITTGEDVPE